MLSKSAFIAKVLMMLALSIQMGCMRHRPSAKVHLDLPNQWHNTRLDAQTSGTKAEEQALWWQQLNDDMLNQLVRQTLDQNYSLAVARSKIIQARADRRISKAALWPEITASTSWQRNQLGYETYGQVIEIFDADINATWNLDLFGQNRHQYAAMKAQLKGTKFAHAAAEIAIVAELIDHYIDLRTMQMQYQYSENICNLLSTLEQLTIDLYQAGLSNAQDVTQAKAVLHKQLAQKKFYKSQITTLIYRLENLCSVMPGHYQQRLSTHQPLPSLPIGLLEHTPASVIQQRPDVRQAEQLLAAKTSLSAAASTMIFPQINLLALFGLDDTSCTPNTKTWSWGGIITLPILNFGRIEAQINKAKAEQNEAFLWYKKIVLGALYDVEIALEDLRQNTLRLHDLQKTVDEYGDATRYTLERYQKGIAAFQEVVNAYQLQFQAQSDYTTYQAQQISAWVGLQKAIGASVH